MSAPRRDALDAGTPGARATFEHDDLIARATGVELRIANEFSEIVVRRVETRNGVRLLVDSPRTGQWVSLCPLELEALTWQDTATFSAMIANSQTPLIDERSDEQ